MHELLPMMLLYLPSTQAVHAALPAAPVKPALHWHESMVDRSEPFETLFAGHKLQHTVDTVELSLDQLPTSQ
jgi:hypothetical protein